MAHHVARLQQDIGRRAQAAFYAGFPDFEVEVVPLKVRKDDKKFRLQKENAATARAKWNLTPPTRADTAWNNIRVLQHFGGLRLPKISEGNNDDFDPMTGSPLHGPSEDSDRHDVPRIDAVDAPAVHRGKQP